MAYYKCGSIHPTQNSNVVVDTASGAIANFQTPLAMPLLKTRFDFKATQEAGTPIPESPKAISGVSAVSVVHCGKNLFDLDYLTASGITIQDGEAIGTAQSFYDNFGTNTEGIKQLKFKANTTYTLSFKAYTDGSYTTSGQGIYFRINYTDGSYTTLAVNNNQQSYGESVKATSANKTIDKIYMVYSSGYSNTWHLKDIQLEEGVSATDFEPYNGTTEVINLGGTYYGGYVSQDKDGKRELVLTWKLLDWTSLDVRRSNNAGQWNAYLFYAFIDDAKIGASLLSEIYTHSYSGSLADMPNNSTRINQSKYLYVRDDSFTDVQTFKNAMLNYKYIYELAEPFTVALPNGQPIKSFAGVNNIYADTGDTSLQFRKIG